jgi:endonuclease/exonuclease/phosphatase (EEP) superfamily protein YafD
VASTARRRGAGVVLLQELCYSQYRRAIVGGDFNTLPDDPALRPMFARFTELDETGVGNAEKMDLPTYAAKKIDYVFLSDGHFAEPRASTVVTRMSDHRVYLGAAAVSRGAG